MLTLSELLLFCISVELLVALLLALHHNKNNASGSSAPSDTPAAFDNCSPFDEHEAELDRAWRETLTELLDYNQDKARGAARGGGQ